MSDDMPPGYHPLNLHGRFYASAGPLYARVMRGKFNLAFRVAEKHTNAADIAHGGALATLADLQIGIGACVEAGIDGFVPTVSLSCDYLAPVPRGSLVEGRCAVARRTRSLVFMEARLDSDGETVVRANGIVKIPRDPARFNLQDILPPPYDPDSD